jgi:starch phosphorylase
VSAGAELGAAQKAVRDRTVFTLHTPVPAGNEVFDSSVARKYLDPWAERMGVSMDELLGLASSDGHDLARFDLGALAIRHADIVNGVSKRHGEVVGDDWRHLIGHDAISVTNGVHTPTWIGRSAASILVRNLGRRWPTRLLENPDVLEQAREIPARTIWNAHQSRKEIFARFAQGRLRRQLARQGASPDELRAVEDYFPMDRLTLGFARRFATYKRATLMFNDWDRLRSILKDEDRPVQIVFAGKAHPADQH